MVAELADSVIVHDRYQNYDSAALGHAGPPVVLRAPAARLRRRRAGLPRRGVAGPDRRRAARADHQANLAREQGLPAIPDDVRDELLRRLRNGMLVGLSDTLSTGTRPGERKARLLLEVLRDRHDDVLRFAHDLKVPPTSNQAERDLRPPRSNRRSPGG